MIKLENNNLYSYRNGQRIPLLNGGDFTFSYTLKNENIRNIEKPNLSPYGDHKIEFDKLNNVKLGAYGLEDGIEIEIALRSKEYSQWGVNLPFNFMGKLNGGGYENQYLFNSPYRDSTNENKFIYLSNPNGNNLLILFASDSAGWKVDYSPFCGGHFFINLKLLAQFDKEYQKDLGINYFKFYILEVNDFDDALTKVNKYLNKPLLKYNLSGGKLGQEININIIGDCDYISDGEHKINVRGKTSLKYVIHKEGVSHLVPYKNSVRGLEATIYGYKNIDSLYEKSIKSISFKDIGYTDGNLCEHQCYVSATLRYLLQYGPRKDFEKIVLKALKTICETDPSKAVHRITVLDKPQEDLGYPAYHVFKSNRIQEQFFGVTIFLDAYKYFKDEKYLRYAVNSLNTLIDVYQRDDGGFYTKMEWNENYDDYSTVTCLIIPIIDMALFMKDKDEALYNKYLLSASKLADHVYKRGLNFPTETCVSDEHEPEMEDGSISCSALTLLYYSNKIKENKEYIRKAREILSLHESWVINSPLCNLYRSSLRWWETYWEGDEDGPALCNGHAWTIWRAEADYWMYKATNDKSYLLKAINSFNSNFAKINSKGESFSCYCIDYITGGGRNDATTIKYKIASSFPKRKDSGLSRYAWIRAADSIIDLLK